MNIKKELIEKLAQGMVENPKIRAEELLKLRTLTATKEWIERCEKNIIESTMKQRQITTRIRSN